MNYRPEKCLSGRYFKCLTTSIPFDHKPDIPKHMSIIHFSIPLKKQESRGDATSSPARMTLFRIGDYKMSKVRRTVHKLKKL